MSEAPSDLPSTLNPNEAWRNFTVASPIAACQLQLADLKRLYKLINEKQIEHRDRILSKQIKIGQETADQFAARVKQVSDAFITTVRVTGSNGQVVTGHGEAFFDSPLLPGQIKSVASQPTPNSSNFLVTAETESWSTSLTSRLREFFDEKGTGRNWLHGPGAYDALLFTVGVPFSLWVADRVIELVKGGNLWPSAVSFGSYIYVFLLAMNVFRAIFMYSRWIFPKVELAGHSRSTQNRHKVILGAIILGIIGSALWDAIKAIAGG